MKSPVSLSSRRGAPSSVEPAEPETTETPSSERFAPGWREWRVVLLIGVVTLVLWSAFYVRNRMVAIQTWDTLDYAQIARNIYEGRGFQSNVLPLGGLEWMRQTGRLGQPWWNFHRFPFPCAAQAALFHVVGANDFGVVLFSALFFFASIPLVFLFARRLFSFRTAALGTALYAFGSAQWADAISGGTEPASVFFFLAALYLIWWRRDLLALVLAGAITGLAYLNRYSVALYVLPMLYLIWRNHRARPWTALLAFCVPMGAVMAPWLARNYLLAGSPTFSLMTAVMARFNTKACPTTDDWYLFVYQSAGNLWKAHPAWALEKALRQTGLLWLNVHYIGGLGAVFGLFVLSVLKSYRGDAERLRRWLLVTVAIHAAVLGLLAQSPRYYTIFWPFMWIYAAEALLWAWGRLFPQVRWANVALAGVLVLPGVTRGASRFLGPPEKIPGKQPATEWTMENQDWLRAHTRPDALIVSNAFWSVAWYAQRRSLSIPPTPKEMPAYARYNLRPDGIYLKALPAIKWEVPEGWREWASVQVHHTPVPGYRLAKVFSDGAVYYERQ